MAPKKAMPRHQFDPRPPRYITIGKFGKPHGVSGGIRVFSYTQPASNIIHYQPWWIQQRGRWSAHTIAHANTKNQPFLVQLTDCDDRDQTKGYANLSIYITRDTLPALEAGHYYLEDLIGAAVINQQRIILGTIDNIKFNKAHPILYIKGEKKRYLIPHVPAIVLNV